MDTSTSAWSVSSGNYSSRFSGVAAGAVHLAARKWRPKLRRFASTWTTISLAATCGGSRALAPGGPTAWDGAGLHETAFCAIPNLEPPDEADTVASSGARLHRRRRRRRGRPADRRSSRARLCDRPRRRPAAQSTARRRTDPRGLRSRRGRRAVRAESSTTTTASCSPGRSWTTCVHGAGPPSTEIAHRRRRHPLRHWARGARRRRHDERPAAIANAVADALGRDDIELPLTPGRTWELLAP